MPKYKLLALDLDETLLTPDKKITERNKEWIVKASEVGVTVIISTGRGYLNMSHFREELGLKTPMVLVNGAEAWNESVEIIDRRLINQEDIHALYKLSLQTNADFWAYGINSFVRRSEWREELLKERWTQFVARHDDIKVLAEFKSQIENVSKSLEITRSSTQNVEFTLKGTSKASGVQAVCEYLNISMSEVMAIGDNFNDMKLIQKAGLGIAMGNAVQELKDFADDITDTNTKDGVAQAIQKYIFENEIVMV
ncbi:Cof-type HAD-IIB family hydrolase [Bacillus niameyensis]|uniref:Cof-type HAD-IIB family hydrolase n=1 Tax=Bacillus niameyensis TaxID=1522308 RepID=UPI0007817D50|nr:Cof-type HAD-IIB family hydrolase [Bacillus niameyensis]